MATATTTGTARTAPASRGLKPSPHLGQEPGAVFFPQEPRGQGGGLTLTPSTGISRILLPGCPGTWAPHAASGGVLLQCPQAGAAEHPSTGTCTLGTSILPGQGAAGPPRPGRACVRCYTPTPSPPHLPLPHRPLGGCSHPALCSWTPLIKGSATLGRVAATGDEGPSCQGCCLHPAACEPPAQAEGHRERQTLKSIY